MWIIFAKIYTWMNNIFTCRNNMILLKTLGQRAKYVRTKLKLEPINVAQLIPMSAQGYRDIESGKAALPRNIIRIAEIFHVSPEWLLFGVGNTPYSDEGEIIVPDSYVPLLKWEDAPFGITQETLKDKKTIIPMRTKGSINSFALEIKDNSMTSAIAGQETFLPGECVIVDPELAPKNGDYVIAIQKGSKDPIFKQYLVEGKDVTLSSLNPRYQSIKFDEKVEICGVVIEKYKSFIES